MDEIRFEKMKLRAIELGQKGLTDLKTVARLMVEFGAKWEEANDAVDYVWGWLNYQFKLETMQ